MPEWSGIIVEKGETAKSFKWTGKTEQGKTNTFWQGRDNKPLPMGEPITITYKESAYMKANAQGVQEEVKSKWVDGYTALQKPQAVQLGQPGTANFATKDTFPSVREQFIKEVVGGWARNGLVLPVLDDLIAATNIAKRAWVSVVEAPMDPSEPNKGLLAPPNAEQVQDLNNQYDPPMPNSPDDYR